MGIDDLFLLWTKSRRINKFSQERTVQHNNKINNNMY